MPYSPEEQPIISLFFFQVLSAVSKPTHSVFTRNSREYESLFKTFLRAIKCHRNSVELLISVCIDPVEMQLPRCITLTCPPLSPHTRQVQQPEACIYLAVHPAQSALLNDEVAGRLQEMRAEVTLLDVIVLIAAVSGPGPGSDGEGHQCFCKF